MATEKGVRDWKRTLYRNPFGTLAALAGTVLGVAGLVMGDGVSQGMTNSLHASAFAVAHLWGAMFAAGGALKLAGLYRHRTTLEIPGLWMLIGGYAFYSITVITGLGTHGLAAGIISAALAAGCALKARAILHAARLLRDTPGRQGP